MTEQKLISQIEFLIKNGEDASPKYNGRDLDIPKYRSFKSSSLSFIQNLFGQDHPYYRGFVAGVRSFEPVYVESGLEILRNIKSEIENGWLNSIRNLVSAEIFTDFMEMAEHLLENDYKDPAAVITGSVLEEHLRQLCLKNDISTTLERNGDEVPKKADRLNSDLAKQGIYNKLVQKSITASLDLRNKAAHGHYKEYDKQQVKNMYEMVINFVATNN